MRAALLVLVVILAGCGGSAPESSRSTPKPKPKGPPTRAQYVRDANRLCEAHRLEIAQVTSESVDRTQGFGRSRATASAIRATLPVLRRNFARARGLARPPADSESIDVFWRRASDSLKYFRRAAKALEDRDPAALARARRGLLGVAGDTRPVARRLGLTACMP